MKKMRMPKMRVDTHPLPNQPPPTRQMASPAAEYRELLVTAPAASKLARDDIPERVCTDIST